MGKYNLDTWTKEFSQDGDCCDDEFQMLQVEQHDGGGGPFWVIKSQRWAFDDLAELIKLLSEAGVPMHAPKEEDVA